MISLKIKFDIWKFKILYNLCFKLKELSNYIIPLWYSEYILYKHENDYQYWYNQLFNNSVWANINYTIKELMFVLFFTNPYHKKIIYQKYGDQFLADINWHNHQACKNLCLYLYNFGLFMDNNLIIQMYNKICFYISNDKKALNNRLFNLINIHFLNNIKQNNKLTMEEINKIEARCFIHKITN